MIVIENDRELQALERLITEQRSTGVNISLLDSGRAREKKPSLCEEIIGSPFCPLDAQVNPLLLVHAFIRSAKERSGQVITDSEVVVIEVISNRVKSVQTKRGLMETSTVINAAGEITGIAGALKLLNKGDIAALSILRVLGKIGEREFLLHFRRLT